ncbi:lytic murein transglycosylase [Oryzibacter oryziterrae]|uniref:lytic murein transglycosylase n=1 Tax=Oryzibacter oryziterrae TaxID=2766474 RepID=UPI001F3F19EA|nr:lytic murein transglycosylase [Oryzibacter oryziterrae]
MARIGAVLGVALLGLSMVSAAEAATCGNTAAGFADWTKQIRGEAMANGVPASTLDTVLRSVSYSRGTISADRGQKSFHLSLDAFMKKRGGPAIASQGKSVLKRNAALFASIEQRFGVPPGPVIAIWGMETGFGSFMGNTPTLSAVATLAYDCRRTEYFTDQFYAALQLVDRGVLTTDMIGAAHGEVGQTQFLPKNVLLYAVDGDGDGRIDLIHSAADALASTANFLRGHGWQPGQGYQPGQPNFVALQGWNAASVYQQAIAIIAGRIDGG